MADVHSTTTSRRATLCGVAALASVAVIRPARASKSKPSAIAALFTRWEEAVAHWDQICDEGIRTSEEFARIRPEVPAILRPGNAPLRWLAALTADRELGFNWSGNFERFPYERIPADSVDRAAEGKYGEPDAWVRDAKSASDAFCRAEEEAKRSSGSAANEEDGYRLTDEISALSDQILALQPADIADIQRQVIVVKYEHFGAEVGRCDQCLFANILAMPSALNGGRANG